MALAAPPAGGRVLDVGCGTGVSTEAAQEAVGGGGLAVGVDMSLGMLSVGRKIRTGLRLAAAEAIDLPFRDATFDAVISNFVIAHFPKYDTAFFDILRVLRPGGAFAVTAWGSNTDEFQKSWRQLAEEVAGQELLDDVFNQVLPWEDLFADRAGLEGALRDAGLHPVRVEQREYRVQMSREDYLAGRQSAVSGRFLRSMLGEEGWKPFMERVRAVFADRFPEQLTDFRDVNLAVGTKPK